MVRCAECKERIREFTTTAPGEHLCQKCVREAIARLAARGLLEYEWLPGNVLSYRMTDKGIAKGRIGRMCYPRGPIR